MIEDPLKLGVQAAKAGYYEKARAYFVKVVQADPDSELGWLYLGHCLNDDDKKKFCYQKVLKINPSNSQARKALANITQADHSEQKSQPVPQSAPETNPQNKPPRKRKTSNAPTVAAIGAGLGFVFCVGVFVVFVGLFAAKSYQSPLDIFLAKPAVTVTATPSFVMLSTETGIPMETPYPTSTFTNLITPGLSFPDYEFPLDEFYDEPQVLSWSEVIEIDPENADAHFQRASIIYNSTDAVGGLETYIARLDLALKDIDIAISLNPGMGDYYSLRQSIYYSLSQVTLYDVDSQYLRRFALDNGIKAYELGTTTEYPDRLIIDDLIFTNQCEEALNRVQKLIDQLPADNVSMGGLLHIRSRLCLSWKIGRSTSIAERFHVQQCVHGIQNGLENQLSDHAGTLQRSSATPQ